MELRAYSVEEVKDLLGLESFEKSQDFVAWSAFHEENIDWKLIEQATNLFNAVTPDLKGLKELVEFMRSQVDATSQVSMVKGCSYVSIRVAPSVKTGVINDTSFLNVGTYWDGQYYIGLSQVGEKGYLAWKTYGQCFRVPLGDRPDLSHKAASIIERVMGKPVVSAV